MQHSVHLLLQKHLKIKKKVIGERKADLSQAIKSLYRFRSQPGKASSDINTVHVEIKINVVLRGYQV